MGENKILIVDDMPLIRDILSKGLKEYTICFAGNGEEAWAQLEKENPKIVLLDINMPKMDGIDFLKKLKDSNKGVHVLIVSAHGTNEMYDKVKDLGAEGFIVKPFRISEIRDKIENIIKNDEMSG